MRYFLGFLITIGLLIFLIVLLFNSNNKPKVPSTLRSLVSYSSTDADVSFMLDGPTNADQIHERIVIVVNKNIVTYQQQQGYDGKIVKQLQFTNNENAFSAFLNALQGVGFTTGKTSKVPNEEQQYCSLGNRYVFSLNQGNDLLERYWATSCKGPQTYGGATLTTVTLFKAQVPEYTTLTENLQSL